VWCHAVVTPSGADPRQPKGSKPATSRLRVQRPNRSDKMLDPLGQVSNGHVRNPIFDAIGRDSLHPNEHEESSFDFYNRIAGEYWDATRARLEEWAAHLPDSAYADVRGRLRSGDDYEFNSTYLEIYLHELLRRAGYAIEVHPTTNSGRRPDFLVSREEESFYLEAVSPRPSKAEQSKSARLRRVYAVLESTSDDWWLWLDEIEEGHRTPPATKLRSAIRAWLRDLDPNDSWETRRRPRFHWALDDWSVNLSAMPRKGIRTDRPVRSIGVYPMQSGFVDDEGRIKKALASKDRAYGQLDRPLVLALGLFTFDRDQWSFANALWGHEAIQVSVSDPSAPAIPIRQPDGYFGWPGNWKNVGVSAVLIVDQLTPTHFPSADVSVWHHAGARLPLALDTSLPISTVLVANEELTVVRPGSTPHEHFDLPDPWPPGEGFPCV